MTFGGSHCGGPVSLRAARSPYSGSPSHGCSEYCTIAVPGGAEETQSMAICPAMPMSDRWICSGK